MTSVSGLNAQAMIIMMKRQMTPMTAKNSTTYMIALQMDGNLDLLTFEAKKTVGSGIESVLWGILSSLAIIDMVESFEAFRILTSTED